MASKQLFTSKKYLSQVIRLKTYTNGNKIIAINV